MHARQSIDQPATVIVYVSLRENLDLLHEDSILSRAAIEDPAVCNFQWDHDVEEGRSNHVLITREQYAVLRGLRYGEAVNHDLMEALSPLFT